MCIRDRVKGKRFSVPAIILIIVGSPIWLSILIAVAASLLALYAVSYTHLDVYKRQVQAVAPQMLRTTILKSLLTEIMKMLCWLRTRSK